MSTELTAKEITTSVFKFLNRNSFLDKKYNGKFPKTVRDEIAANKAQIKFLNSLTPTNNIKDGE